MTEPQDIITYLESNNLHVHKLYRAGDRLYSLTKDAIDEVVTTQTNIIRNMPLIDVVYYIFSEAQKVKPAGVNDDRALEIGTSEKTLWAKMCCLMYNPILLHIVYGIIITILALLLICDYTPR